MFLNDCLLKGPKSVQLKTCTINLKANRYEFTVNFQKILQIIIKNDYRNIFKFMFPIDPSSFTRKIKAYRIIVVHFRINYLLYHLAAVIGIHLYIDRISKLVKDILFKELYVDKYGQEQYFQKQSPKGQIQIAESKVQSPKCKSAKSKHSIDKGRVPSVEIQVQKCRVPRAESQVQSSKCKNAELQVQYPKC